MVAITDSPPSATAAPELLVSPKTPIPVFFTYPEEPFGDIAAQSGALADDNPFRFSSKYHDDETGFLYYGYRYYFRELGRWLSRDPLGDLVVLKQRMTRKSWRVQKRIREESRNPSYLYLRNSPLVSIDINGLVGWIPRTLRPWDGQFHGQWCGGNWTAGDDQEADEYDWENDPDDAVDDDLDRCCREHDACYAGWDLEAGDWFPDAERPDHETCDDQLCDCSRQVNIQGVADTFIQCYFCDEPEEPPQGNEDEDPCFCIFRWRF